MTGDPVGGPTDMEGNPKMWPVASVLDDYLLRHGFDAPAHCNSVTKAITGLAGDDAIIEQMHAALREAGVFTGVFADAVARERDAVRAALRAVCEP